MREKLFYLIAIVVGGWIGWMYLDNQPPYVWDAAESYVVPNPTEDGSRVSVSWKMKVNRLCPGSSQRILTDASTRRVDDQDAPLPHSGRIVATYDSTAAAISVRLDDSRLIRTFVLPRGLPPLVGYSSTVCFACNPLQAFFPLCIRTPELIFAVRQ